MKKKWWLSLGLVLLIFILSAIFWGTRKSFEVVYPKTGSITEAVYGLGTVKSRRVYEVKLGVLNSIKKIYFREGDKVRRGARLITFYEGAFFDAPFSGTLTNINFHEGEIAPIQSTILRLEDLKDLYIEVSLEQESALRVTPGQSTKVIFESIRGEVLQGKVGSLFPRGGEFLAHIDVAELSDRVLTGMTADITIEVGKIEKAKLIPVAAIHNGMVIVRRDGKRKKINVEVGHIDHLWAEIKDDSIQLSDEILIPSKKEK